MLHAFLQVEIEDQLWLENVDNYIEPSHWILKQDGSRRLEPHGARLVLVKQGCDTLDLRNLLRPSCLSQYDL